MLVKSGTTEPGDKTEIISPQTNLSAPRLLRFVMHMATKESSTNASLQIFKSLY